jgi:hypothetical protein
MSKVTYADIQAYLEAIANNPNNNRDTDSSGHGRFWNVPYNQFINGTVPNEDCNGNAIRIVDPDPAKCPLYQALKGATGWCNSGQMPMKGPYITAPGYCVKLADGTNVSGAEIDANLVWWLTIGMPEH